MTERSVALALGTLAAVVTALPAVPRVTAAGVSGPLVFLALAGGSALVLGPVLVLAGALQPSPGQRASLVGLALSAMPLSVLAEFLKRGTHHRPLGAATFAVLALGMVLVCVGVALRALSFAESGDTTAKRAVRVVALVVALASVGWVVVRAFGSATLVPDVLDGLRAVATATMGHLLLRAWRVRLEGIDAKWWTRLAVPTWVAFVVAGIAALHGAVGSAVEASAPVLGGPLAWF
ncbi:MAG TPA: hypothetical protein VF103_05265 [Polyangiaceae bacterium]